MLEIDMPMIIGFLVLVGVASIALAPRVRTADGLYRGWTRSGTAPEVLALTFSQVTTWTFTRSLLNVGILGYFYGIAGGSPIPPTALRFSPGG